LPQEVIDEGQETAVYAAVVESFFASLKTELVAEARWESRAGAKSAVVAWIEGWYNRERLHSTLGYISPVQFEEQIAANTT
jgi:putative transposase